MFCKNCGKQTGENEAFCSNCGTPVTQPNMPQQPMPQQPNMQQQPMPQQPMPQQPIRQQPMPPKKQGGKGLMIALICVGSAAILAFAVFAYFTWIQPPNTPAVGIAQPPEATQIQQTSAVSEVPVETVEQPPQQTFASTTQEYSEKILGAWEIVEDGTYVAFEFFDDGTLVYTEDTEQDDYTYIVANDKLVLTDDTGDSGEIQIGFREEGGVEYITVSANEESYELMRVDAISPPTPVVTQAPTQGPQLPTSGLDPDVVFANGFVVDIESYLSETWWGSTGIWVDNPTAPVQAPGYPKVYEIGEGELQYIFDTSAGTVQMLVQEADGSISDRGLFEYMIDPHGFFLYAFDRMQNIEGADYNIMSMFFVCDDVLYEVEVVDNMEASNYIAYQIWGP